MADEKPEASPTLEELEDIVIDDSGPGTIADTLREAMAAQELENTDDEEVKSAEPEGKDEQADQSDDEGKDDDGDGEVKDDDDGEVKDDDQETKGAADEDEDTGDKDAQIPEPPPEWSPDDHKMFHAMTPESQQFVLDRVGEAVEAASESKKAGDKTTWIEELADQETTKGVTRRQYWERSGWDTKRAVTMILSLADHAQSDPISFIQNLARDRGIDLTNLGAKVATGADDVEDTEDDPFADDPAVQHLRTEISGLRDEMVAIKDETTKATDAQTKRVEEEKAAYNQRLDKNIETFKAETGDDGKSKHPYFDEVRAHMGVMMDGGLESSLESAYKSACRAHPAVSAKIEQARRAQVSRDQEEVQRKKAAKARETGSSVTGETDTVQGPAYTGDLRDDLREAFENAGLL